MKNRICNPGLICLILIGAMYHPSFGNSLEMIGLYALRTNYPTVNGSGVKVAQPEAKRTNDWQINPAAVNQPESKFRWIFVGTATNFPNALGVESEHANAVGLNFFGNSGGVAPGVSQIDNYEAGYFYNFIVNAALTIPAKIVNQSFIFLGTSNEQRAVEQVYDNYAANNNVLFLSGIGNGGAVSPPGTGYNGIGVGAFGGSSSFGPTLNGRCKPDITAPADLTSYSTPLVAGAAAILVQAGNEGVGGPHSNAVTDIRTLKALLLNGAVKPNDWTNHPSKPLDLRYGSGVLNILNSYKQLSFGKQNFLEATSHIANGIHPPGTNQNNLSGIGWDFNSITNSGAGTNTQDRVNHYYFLIPTNGTAHMFNATLTWNRAAGNSGINNLNLFLYNANSGASVAVSTSAVDNVEHIFIPYLAPGRYNLQVWKSATSLTTTETYALVYEAVSTSLQMARNGNELYLTWPAYPHGFGLEFADNLNLPISWNPVNGSPTISGQNYQQIVSAPEPQRFYRLRRP